MGWQVLPQWEARSALHCRGDTVGTCELFPPRKRRRMGGAFQGAPCTQVWSTHGFFLEEKKKSMEMRYETRQRRTESWMTPNAMIRSLKFVLYMNNSQPFPGRRLSWNTIPVSGEKLYSGTLTYTHFYISHSTSGTVVGPLAPIIYGFLVNYPT